VREKNEPDGTLRKKRYQGSDEGGWCEFAIGGDWWTNNDAKINRLGWCRRAKLSFGETVLPVGPSRGESWVYCW